MAATIISNNTTLKVGSANPIGTLTTPGTGGTLTTFMTVPAGSYFELHYANCVGGGATIDLTVEFNSVTLETLKASTAAPWVYAAPTSKRFGPGTVLRVTGTSPSGSTTTIVGLLISNSP